MPRSRKDGSDWLFYVESWREICFCCWSHHCQGPILLHILCTDANYDNYTSTNYYTFSRTRRYKKRLIHLKISHKKYVIYLSVKNCMPLLWALFIELTFNCSVCFLCSTIKLAFNCSECLCWCTIHQAHILISLE